jgi:hypothetical protein
MARPEPGVRSKKRLSTLITLFTQHFPGERNHCLLGTQPQGECTWMFDNRCEVHWGVETLGSHSARANFFARSALAKPARGCNVEFEIAKIIK